MHRPVATNLIPNGDFAQRRKTAEGLLPTGWTLKSPSEYLTPHVTLVRKEGGRVLQVTGGGSADCFGWLTAPVTVEGGKSYRLRASVQLSPDMDAQQNLLFALYTADFNQGIFHFDRRPDLWVEGENTFTLPGAGPMQAEVQIVFRFSAIGKLWVREIALEECDPLPPRWVRVACVAGVGDLAHWGAVLDAAGQAGADLVLLPETFHGTERAEPLDGPCGALLQEKAQAHHMYVGGTFYYHDRMAHRMYNCGVLYDRAGNLTGKYYKNHPYTPELYEGITPGTDVPVWNTDFGKVGMMICYDSWFTDVAELLALRGAEIVLFPCAGYYRSLMPARAADNGVRVVCSCLNTQSGGYGVWDTSGADVCHPDADPSRHAGDAVTFREVQIIEPLNLLLVSLDLSQSPSPHNWGGPMRSAPGGRRNRREQKRSLWDDLQREQRRWWE